MVYLGLYKMNFSKLPPARHPVRVSPVNTDTVPKASIKKPWGLPNIDFHKLSTVVEFYYYLLTIIQALPLKLFYGNSSKYGRGCKRSNTEDNAIHIILNVGTEEGKEVSLQSVGGGY